MVLNRKPPPEPTLTPYTSFPGNAFRPHLSPDGQRVAFVWDGGTGNFDIFVRLVNAGDPLRVTTNEAQDLDPAWSPDGRQIEFIRRSPEKQELYVIPSLGGAERKIAEISSRQRHWAADGARYVRSLGPMWSPNGAQIAVTNAAPGEPDSIYLINIETGGKTPPDDSREFGRSRFRADIFAARGPGGFHPGEGGERAALRHLRSAADGQQAHASNLRSSPVGWHGVDGRRPHPLFFGSRRRVQAVVDPGHGRVSPAGPRGGHAGASSFALCGRTPAGLLGGILQHQHLAGAARTGQCASPVAVSFLRPQRRQPAILAGRTPDRFHLQPLRAHRDLDLGRR
jgi:hypothetical protein